MEPSGGGKKTRKNAEETVVPRIGRRTETYCSFPVAGQAKSDEAISIGTSSRSSCKLMSKVVLFLVCTGLFV